MNSYFLGNIVVMKYYILKEVENFNFEVTVLQQQIFLFFGKWHWRCSY